MISLIKDGSGEGILSMSITFTSGAAGSLIGVQSECPRDLEIALKKEKVKGHLSKRSSVCWEYKYEYEE